jgi:hypothetical protein
MYPRHAFPRSSWRIGDRLTVAAVHLIVGRPMPAASGAGQPGRHAAQVNR